MDSWFATPAGRYLLDWERARFDAAVDDIFGYHGVQLGLSSLDGLASSRVRRRWLAAGSHDLAMPRRHGSPPRHALATDFSALPFAAGSMDLVLMPHTLDLAVDPHAALREAERVLVPEGKLVICGLNPTSLWGLKQRRARLLRTLGLGGLGLGDGFIPPAFEGIGYWRLRDWLRLLSFEVESGQFGCFRPAVRSQAWLDRTAWLDTAGDRWWPIFGAAYFVVATKRVAGMRLMAPAWKARSVRKDPAAVPVAGRDNAARLVPGQVPAPRPAPSPDP
ncbi:methyltransferase domain-containing protein [Xylophilus sp. Kf1]|nr:methyltransferase domain-containing protein [Xylophilus sp. Kf1]